MLLILFQHCCNLFPFPGRGLPLLLSLPVVSKWWCRRWSEPLVATRPPVTMKASIVTGRGVNFQTNLTPICDPNGTQNPPKINPRAIQNPSQHPSCLRSFFSLILFVFFIDLRPQINENSTKKPSTPHPNNTTTKSCRCHKYIVKTNTFLNGFAM